MDLPDQYEHSRNLDPIHCTGLQIASFNYPIYLKDNSAVFEVAGPTWTAIYFARFG